MNGMRFRAGLLGGLLMGLIVIGSTGFLTFGLFGTFAFSPTNSQVDLSVKHSTSTVASTTTSFTSTTVAPIGGVVAPGQTTSTVTTAISVTGNGTNPTYSSNDQAATGGYSFLNSLSNNLASLGHAPSAVNTLTSQPSSAKLVVLVPILVAFLLGAVYYRVSASRRDAD